MEDYSISNYDIFNEASSTTSTLIKDIENEQNLIAQYQSELTGDSVFMGPICDSCIESLKKIDAKGKTILENLQTIRNYFIKTSEAYQKGDKDAASLFLGADTNSISFDSYLNNGGSTVKLPSGLGKIHSYMGWQCITSKTSNQYKLRSAAGMNFDSNGFGKIGDRYVVATTTTFGNVGDFIDVKQNDGSVIPCVIGDIKSQRDKGCNKWGHNNGKCVVEFVVDKSSWYGTSKTVRQYHPEFNQDIAEITNKGNYFDIVKKQESVEV